MICCLLNAARYPLSAARKSTSNSGSYGQRAAGSGRRSLKWLLLLMAVRVLTGCVSTEDLYARYDQPLCPEQVVLPPVPVPPQPWHWSVFFGYNRSDLSPRQTARLESNLQWLNNHPGSRVLLRGFSDSVGSQQYNLPLSRRRAHAVADWLIDHGLASDRIRQVWAGKILLLDTRRPTLHRDHGEALNRRVELLPIDLKGQPLPLEKSASQPVNPDLPQTPSDRHSPSTGNRPIPSGPPLFTGMVPLP